MRYIIPLLLLVIISSCGTNRIRYVRSKGQPKEIVKSPSLEKQNYTRRLSDEQLANEINLQKEESILVESTSEQTLDAPEVTLQETDNEHFVENNATEEEEDDSRVVAAKNAERIAKKSRNNLRLSMIFLGISMIPILSILFFLPSIILMVIGAIQYFTANSSRYITQDGEDMLHKAKIMLLVWLFIFLLVLGIALWVTFMFL